MSPGPALLLGGGVALAVAALTMTAAALVARRQGRVAVVDIAWGLGFVAITAVGAVLATIRDAGDGWRTALLVGLVGAWGLRLSWHLLRRDHGGEDPRYEKLLGGTVDRVGLGIAIRKVFAVQGAVMAVIALPAAAGVFAEVRWGWAVAAGAAVWLVGLVFEAVGDAQLASYKGKAKDERPPVLDTGLWRYTRHPNYFGDACVWWGIWLAGGLASGGVIGLATVLAPVAMSYFLVEATGAKLQERTMMQRPGYPEYAARTSKFVPLPPSRG